MSKQIEKLYRFSPLSEYSLKQRLAIRAADWAFFLLIKLIGSTLRFETEGWEHFETIERNGKKPIYAFWHNRIFPGTYFFRDRGIVVLTSQSFDGEYIARFIQRLGYGAIRGSSSRGGAGALVEMIRHMRRGLPMAFTVDGPRGPRYEAKTGAVLLAKKTGHPIMPFVVEAKKYWTVRSWDKLQIPKPFSRTNIIIAKPLYVPANADNDEIEHVRSELQKSLDELVGRGEQWRQGITN